LTLPSLQAAPTLEDEGELEAFLLSTYRLTFAAPGIFSSRDASWSSRAFFQIADASSSHSDGAKLLALRIFSSLESVSEAAHEELQMKLVGMPTSVVKDESTGNVAGIRIKSRGQVLEEVDAWIAPLHEEKRVKLIRQAAKEHLADSVGMAVQMSQLSARTASIGGYLFYRPLISSSVHSKYRETERLQPTLCSFGEKLSKRLPILISGPEACGKTSLVHYACSLLYPNVGSSQIITLQLGDQSGIDAKSLIGSFISSTRKPGTFEWAEGVLSRAVRMGKWVVLEDIDRASGEVLSVIKPFVEAMCKTKTIGARPWLDLGHRGRVQAGHSFALFSTRTTPTSKNQTHMPRATFFSHEHWDEVPMQALDQADILEIVKSNNNLLSSAQDDTLPRLVNTWLALIAAAASKSSWSSSSRDRQSTGTVRVPSFHDLLKWCRRIETSLQKAGPAAQTLAKAPLSNQALQEEIAMEACDIFLGSTPVSLFAPSAGKRQSKEVQGETTDRYTAMIMLLADNLSVDPMALWHNVGQCRPECKVESSIGGEKIISIGRGQLKRSSVSDSTHVAPISRNFAMTAPAARLMEKIAVCVSLSEPALIVGETGTGKTTVVQHLASLCRRPMIALNLSQQTETSDLLGGFKPLDPKLPAMEIHNVWIDLFQRTFSSRRNARFLQAERKALQAEKWSRLAGTWKESVRLALNKLARDNAKDSDVEMEEQQRASKARRLTNGGEKKDRFTPPKNEGDLELTAQWKAFEEQVDSFAVQFTGKKQHLVFAFVEGPLIKAIRSGAWVLLDEINLATSETLDCLTALLQSPESSIVLTERGDLEPVSRHPDFRLFACMNPATDVGKKDLPSSLRSRFTEVYAPSPDSDQEALTAIVEQYIGQESVGDRGIIADVAQCYAQIRNLAQSHQLADGANQRPHYSIRTLSRALIFAKDICSVYGLRRAVWEGFTMTFTMLLEEKSAVVVRDLVHKEILLKARNAKSAALFVPSKPAPTSEGVPLNFVQLGSFWIETGGFALDTAEEYILTPSVQDKLVGLARTALTRRSPVLIQGPTSAGKTSAIEYLARRTGHKFVRINNHEHTDIQEYIGSYSSDADSGRLVFHEGLLVTALRQGHWIVLDELNLAPTDVLEALNRLLDDNRELVIPETGQVVKPHPHFMLFATQNPPGLYAGRKVLSRAFRNRFLEIHFSEVPQAELQTILTNRCRIAPSYAEKIVQVFRELQRRRQTERVFDTKQAFVTLRDLFRWGNREADNYQQLAENGYMLIAERARRSEDAQVVRQVIEEVVNVKIDVDGLYDIFNPDVLTRRVGQSLSQSLFSSIHGTGIVWTTSMQRLVCLIASSLRNDEPVLLVGETGSGKTSVCEVIAKASDRSLITVNCHQSTDTADLIGSQRPLRNRSALREAARQNAIRVLPEVGVEIQGDEGLETLSALLSKSKPSSQSREQIQEALSMINHSLSLFEWSDGPLVQAMREGNHMLLDEISLADDSVLERLNSVLEPGRTLVLAERSNSSAMESLEIRANESFQVVATMNPGGDYGKRELSPALRNRFTEIWVPPVQFRQDFIQIINSQWSSDIAMEKWAGNMVDFMAFYCDTLGGRDSNAVGLRDLIAWARFINAMAGSNAMSVKEAFAHGAFMTLIDGVALHPWVASKPREEIRSIVRSLSTRIFDMAAFNENERMALYSTVLAKTETHFSIGHFSCPLGTSMDSSYNDFNLQASTPAMNALRVLRAMQIKERAIMLEGSPGAGKTSLIVALSKVCNHKLTRINLSDQTELSDLFGADLPVEGGKAGEFDWRDAAFLQAMQEGSWVLLDEMNLASQSVLEGLNSCLDHRGAVFIPELARTFTKHPDFRIFAAQNPQHQGGGRKGLPKSFLNRFTKVYVEELHDEDFKGIISALYPQSDQDTLAKMIKFNGQLQRLLQDTSLFSKAGQPWEFNLRDLLRWQSMMNSALGLNIKQADPLEYFASLYLLRFRNRQDRVKVARLYQSIFDVEPKVDYQPWTFVSPRYAQLGHVILQRGDQRPVHQHIVNVDVPKNHLAALQALGECVRLGWPSIVVGESQSGKTSLIRHLASIANRELEEVKLNSGTDAVDVLGGFQQVNVRGDAVDVLATLQITAKSILSSTAFLVEGDAQDRDGIWQARKSLHKLAELLKREEPISQVAFEDFSAALRSLLSYNGLSTIDRTICEQAAIRLESLLQQDLSQPSAKFAWVDGPVLRAMRKGSWLLLDDANLCSSSVLDRLNSLLEPGGTLVMSERGVVEGGQIEVISPHPDFRIFFAIDSRYGELSRAMRNRGLEIFLDRFEEEERSCEVVQEASMRDIKLWTQPIQAREESFSDRLSVLLALFGSGASPLTFSLGQRILDLKHWQHLEPILGSSIITFQSQTLKASLIEGSFSDAALLKETGLDLQLNPYTYKNVAGQNELSSRIQLAVKTSTFLAHLRDQAAIFQSDTTGHSMSILQKSSLFNRGIEVDQLARQDRHLYSLVETIAISLHSSLLTSSVLEEQALDDFITLLDCSVFLALKWASAFLNDYSVTRIIIEKMQAALNDLNNLGIASLGDVDGQMDSVSRQVTLTSGLAMHEIWRAFLPSTLNAEAVDLATRISQTLSRGRGKLEQDLVNNAVDVAATLWQVNAEWSEENRIELFAVAGRIITAMNAQLLRSMETEMVVEQDDDVLLLSSLLLALNGNAAMEDSIHRQRQRSLVDLIKSSRTYPLHGAVSLQRQASVIRSNDLSQSDVFAADYTWVRSVFKSVTLVNGEAGNTQDLFRPVLLHTVLQSCSPSIKTSFVQLQAQEQRLKRVATIVGNASPTESVSRSKSISHLLQSSIEEVAITLMEAFQKELQGTELSTMVDSTSETQSYSDRLLQLDALMPQVSAIFSSASVSKNLRACLDLGVTVEATSQSDSSCRETGVAAVQFAMTLLDSYLPNVAIDPLVTQLTEDELRLYKLNRLQEEKAAVIEIESSVTGNSFNTLTEALDLKLASLAASTIQDGSQSQGSWKRATNTDLLQKMHREITSFTLQVLDVAKMEQILLHLDDESVRGRLLNLQSTICAMLDRLTSIYDSLWDLVRPLEYSLSILLLGLGLLLHSTTVKSRSSIATRHEQLLGSIVAFPTTVATSLFSRQEIPMKIKADSAMGAMAVPLLLLKVRGIVFDLKLGHTSANLVDQLRSAYDQLWYLWTLDEEHQKQQKEEDTSLYKVKKLDFSAEQDEQREEEEFLAYFPQYADIMQDSEINQVNGIVKPAQGSRKGTFFREGDSLQLFNLHLAFFEDECLRNVDTFGEARVTVSRILMQSSYAVMSEHLDKTSAGLQVSLLHQSLFAHHESSERDFYTESNQSEAKTMLGVVDRVVQRLDELIKDWPDQEVLHHIKQRSERILAMDSASPVNQMLAALEGLLLHTEDWQIYANSKNSLQPQRDEIVALIIEWRRLELRGWKTLLNKESNRSKEGVSEMWFTVFQVVAKVEYEEEKQCDELVSLLDQFLRGSTLGQYSTRLQLVHSLALYLRALRTRLGQTNLQQAESTLYNVHCFFAQFEPSINEKLNGKRKAIEKDIADYVKLASWKDTNVDALKVSAAKTHRKLHRCLRRFRDALNEAVDPVLAAYKDTKDNHVNGAVGVESRVSMPSDLTQLDNTSSWHIDGETPAHLVALSTTLKTLHSLHQREINPLLQKTWTSEAILDLSSTIIAQSEALAKQTPAIWKEETEKLVKHLETRKRKAWSDLLRELRRIGLNVSSIDGVSSEHLTRASFIYALPVVDNQNHHLSEANRIHYRLLSLLPVLRATISSTTRNPDIHIRELQKGLSFVENAFLASLAERRKLSAVLLELGWVQKVKHRVQSLVEGEDAGMQLLPSGDPSSLLSCLDLWARLQSALEEIQTKSSMHAAVLPDGQRGYEEALAEIGNCRDEAALVNSTLSRLVDYFDVCKCTLLSREETTVVQGCAKLVEKVLDTLQRAIQSAPSIRSMCIPTFDWIRTAQSGLLLEMRIPSQATFSVDIGKQSDNIISSILVIAQELRKLSPPAVEDDSSEELPDRGIVQERHRLASLQNTLRVPKLMQEIQQCFALADADNVSSKVIRAAMTRLSPFLDMYCTFIDDFVDGCSKWYKGLLKLDLTLCKLLISLSSIGFCKPRQEEEQSGEAGTEQDEQLEGGMGLGEGEGAKDVTDTLQEDEMMEELETGEKEDKGDAETKGEKNAREMQDDFDGDMGDVEKEEGDDEKDGSEDEDDIKSEVESAVGDVDPLDLDAVDEKTWGGQEDEKKDEGKDKNEKEMEGKNSEDAGEEGKKAPQAKEGEDEGAEGAGQRGQEGAEKKEDEKGDAEKKDGEEGEEQGKEQGKEEGAEEDETEPMNEEEQEEQDAEQAEGLGRAIDQEAQQQADNLDLDEDLKLEEGADQGSSDGGDDDGDMDGPSAIGDDDDARQDDPLSPDQQEATEETSKAEKDAEAQKDQVPEEGEEEAQVPHGPGEEPMEEDEEEGADDADENIDQEGGAKDQSQMMQQDSGLADDTGVDDSAMAGDASQDNPTNQQQSTKSSFGRQANSSANEASASMPEGEARDQDKSDADPAQPQDKEEAQGGGAQREDRGKEGQEQGDEGNDDEIQSARSLGDALKEFKRNMDAIEERLIEEARKGGAGMAEEEPTEVEHIGHDEDSEMQAMGAAQEDEALQTVDNLAIEDPAEGEDESRGQVDEEVKLLEAEEEKQVNGAPEEEDQDAKDGMQGDGLMTSDIQKMSIDQENGVNVEDEEDMVSEKSENEAELLDEAIESQMDILFSTTDLQHRLQVAQELWKAYLEATADYAFTLSEQLRLILAPTKATKLTGDFKTGKRLNMRKIIPFIASDYLKDKIWLRRNLAQKREYQVLLSIDDSKSMLESKNMLLAYKSLALVCSALDKLEVGQIGVMKFGKEIELLKGFEGDTIREDQGGKILERLQFQQKGTDVCAMLQSSYKVMTQARINQSTSTSSQLWQLQIIISDGICQDHAKLQTLLRRASEERIMLVFVILDSLQQNSSILTMNSVQYTTNPTTGRPTLQMTRYLDTFPFEYFVVVRDVSDLPNVLSTTLRQWAQKIAEA
jgi:midasin